MPKGSAHDRIPGRDPAGELDQTGLAGFILLSVGAVVSELLQIQMLVSFEDGSYATPGALNDATVTNDARQRVARLARLAAHARSGILILVWIWRANRNAHALGAAGMRFTPAWAVGWFFIPLANLVKPFDVMREIWRARDRPGDWQRHQAPAVIGWWWLFLLVAIIAGNVAPRLALRATSLEALIDATWVTVTPDIAGILASAVLLRIISGVQRMQLAHRAAPAADGLAALPIV